MLKTINEFWGQDRDYHSLKKEVRWFDLRFNSTTLTNFVVIGIFYSVIFLLPQSSEIVFYFLDNLDQDPWATTLLICYLGFVLYACTHFAEIQRRKSDKLITRKYRDIGVDLFTYATPFVIQAYLIWYTGLTFGNWQFILISLILLSLCALLMIGFMKLPQEMDSKEGVRNFFTSYERRINCSVLICGVLTMLILVPLYYWHTHIKGGFDNEWGIGPLDVIIVTLIFFRLHILGLHYIYSSAPRISQIVDVVKDKKYNFSIRNYIGIIGSVLILIWIFLVVWNSDKYLNHFEVKTADAQCADRMSFHEYTREWLLSRKNNGENIYLVAGQGGGSRAGYWMATGLSILDSISLQDSIFFYDNLFALSTVSGSSVGATVYLNAKKNLAYKKKEHKGISISKIEKFFGRDYFSSSLVRLFFLLPIERAWPGILTGKCRNRNDQLMCEENRTFRETFDLDTSSDYNLNKEYDLVNTHERGFDSPLLFMNTYNITEQKKSVIAPVDINFEPHEDFLESLLIDSSKNVSYSQAVNLSQMFPLMSASASTFGSKQYYDGGAYDNSGLSTIRDIYAVLSMYRDMYCAEKRIFVLFAQNSKSVTTAESLSNNALATLTMAVSGSIFSANIRKHESKLLNSIKANGDTLVQNWVSYDKITLNRWLRVEDMHKMNDCLLEKIPEAIESFRFNRRVKDVLHHSNNIYFEFGESSLDPIESNKVKALMTGIKPLEIVLHGHADKVGGKTSNAKLINERIKSVADFLIEKCDVDPSIIKPYNNGQTGTYNDLNRQLNRVVRIEFTFYKSNGGYFSRPVPNSF